ncbi:MAG: AbrB/MazE/SpoVT family DNA-binding domain-containing protein [Nanoarchaeota archaeon]
MRRKLIRMAGITSVVSMPKAWIDKHHLQKGQEVELIERPNGMLIQLDMTRTADSCTIDASSMDFEAARDHILAAYVNGYDEIKVEHRMKDSEELMVSLSQEMIGFEVSEYRVRRITYRNVGGRSTSSFSLLLRSAFEQTVEFAEDVRSMASRQDDELSLKGKAASIKKFIYFAMRMLNQGEEGQRGNVSFHLVVQLKHVINQYVTIADLVLASRFRLQKKTLDLMNRTNELMALVSQPDHSDQALNGLRKEVNALTRQILLFRQKSPRLDLQVVSSLLEIVYGEKQFILAQLLLTKHRDL